MRSLNSRNTDAPRLVHRMAFWASELVGRRPAWLALGPCAAAALLSALMAAPASAAQNAVVKHFSNGNSLNSIGIIDASPDAPEDGPQALYAADDGSLYLLDQINGRVLRFDAKNPGAPAQSLELPEEMRPTDLLVRRGSVYVWDGAPQALEPTGRPDAPTRGLARTRSTEPVDDFTLSAFAQMGSQAPDSPDDLLNERARGIPVKKAPARQLIDTRGRGAVTADVTASDKLLNSAQVDVREHASGNPIVKLRLQVRDRIGVVEFLEIDNSGHMFVLTENIPTYSKRPSAAFVVRFSPKGVQESVYDIPLQDSVALSRRFIAISPDGDVFFLRTRKTDVDVIGVASRNVRANAVIENPSLQFFTEPDSRFKGPIAAVRPLSRQVVVENAFAFEGYQWPLTPSAYGADPDTACSGFNRIRRPGYLFGKLNQQVRGVPYCWGCFGSLNQFRARIAGGMLAGNVCTHNDPRPDVAGVDCSAFVSAAWGLNNHFTTSAIPAITTELTNAWDLQAGDALNKPGSHVMLFLRFTPDRRAEVMESSTGGCNGKVCRNTYPLASLLARGYRPVRYRALASEQVAQVAFPDAQKPDASKAETRKTGQADKADARKTAQADKPETRNTAQADDHPVHQHKKRNRTHGAAQ
jgi:hypothetical protein